MDSFTLQSNLTTQSTPNITLPHPKVGPTEPIFELTDKSSLESALNSLFPTEQEENKVSKMKKHLGETAKELSDAQVETIISEFKFLIDSWLDEYERNVFDGQTLKEILNGA